MGRAQQRGQVLQKHLRQQCGCSHPGLLEPADRRPRRGPHTSIVHGGRSKGIPHYCKLNKKTPEPRIRGTTSSFSILGFKNLHWQDTNLIAALTPWSLIRGRSSSFPGPCKVSSYFSTSFTSSLWLSQCLHFLYTAFSTRKPRGEDTDPSSSFPGRRTHTKLNELSTKWRVRGRHIFFSHHPSGPSSIIIRQKFYHHAVLYNERERESGGEHNIVYFGENANCPPLHAWSTIALPFTICNLVFLARRWRKEEIDKERKKACRWKNKFHHFLLDIVHTREYARQNFKRKWDALKGETYFTDTALCHFWKGNKLLLSCGTPNWAFA